MSDINAAQPLPERDRTKPAEQQGLFRKFLVIRTDGSSGIGGKHEHCENFVLDVNHDPHAPAALAAYANEVERTHPALAADMRQRYALPAVQAQPLTWYDGAPPFPQDQEWFIAETIYGDRVVLRSLDEGREHKGNYAFKTADETYMKAEIVKRWMQFPDCEYLPPKVEVGPPAQPQSEPLKGWKLVPMEPTREMAMAGLEFTAFPRSVYRAMLAAAPAQPPEQAVEPQEPVGTFEGRYVCPEGTREFRGLLADGAEPPKPGTMLYASPTRSVEPMPPLPYGFESGLVQLLNEARGVVGNRDLSARIMSYFRRGIGKPEQETADRGEAR